MATNPKIWEYINSILEKENPAKKQKPNCWKKLLHMRNSIQ
jgi:hypothetical protein